MCTGYHCECKKDAYCCSREQASYFSSVCKCCKLVMMRRSAIPFVLVALIVAITWHHAAAAEGSPALISDSSPGRPLAAVTTYRLHGGRKHLLNEGARLASAFASCNKQLSHLKR